MCRDEFWKREVMVMEINPHIVKLVGAGTEGGSRIAEGVINRRRLAS